MGNDKGIQSGSSKFRYLAEERLRTENISGTSLPDEESRRLIHELQVHQIELEMQNEELMQARAEREKIEAQLGTYSELYEFAPVGYFNLDRGGIIRAVNLTGARFLGVERSLLISRRLDFFISDATRPVFHEFLDMLFARKTTETCEFVFRKEKNPARYVQLEALVSESGEECRAVIIDITGRKQAEEQLQASLAEKNVILSEIHHRVKNNLQVISSLVSLQADTLADKGMRQVFDDVRDRIRAMALVHEKLYQTGDLAHLNFADYTASLLQYLWRSHGALAEKVLYNVAASPVTLPIETAVPCGLILNELAGNALKHAFPNGSAGEVTVGLELDPTTETLCLRVRDNGVGLPEGLELRQSCSLGLRLVEMLACQLRGTVETGPGPGAEFRIIFSLKGNNL
jgi:PAS domain S-box-containing protein